MLKFYIITLLLAVINLSNAQLIDYDKIDTAKVYKSIEEALLAPKAVYRLDLTKKKLTTFPSEILQLTNLNELILDKNKLDSIPPTISKLVNLQRISAYRNHLSNISFIIGLPNLVKIDFTTNYIEAIPEGIANLNQLRIINLQLNIVSIFPDELREMQSLEKINLLDNDLNHEQQKRVRTLFSGLKVEMSEPCNCNFED